jgi:hypothetical protein
VIHYAFGLSSSPNRHGLPHSVKPLHTVLQASKICSFQSSTQFPNCGQLSRTTVARRGFTSLSQTRRRPSQIAGSTIAWSHRHTSMASEVRLPWFPRLTPELARHCNHRPSRHISGDCWLVKQPRLTSSPRGLWSHITDDCSIVCRRAAMRSGD